MHLCKCHTLPVPSNLLSSFILSSNLRHLTYVFDETSGASFYIQRWPAIMLALSRAYEPLDHATQMYNLVQNTTLKVI
jgi:hypothetical protein